MQALMLHLNFDNITKMIQSRYVDVPKFKVVINLLEDNGQIISEISSVVLTVNLNNVLLNRSIIHQLFSFESWDYLLKPTHLISRSFKNEQPLTITSLLFLKLKNILTWNKEQVTSQVLLNLKEPDSTLFKLAFSAYLFIVSPPHSIPNLKYKWCLAVELKLCLQYICLIKKVIFILWIIFASLKYIIFSILCAKMFSS